MLDGLQEIWFTIRQNKLRTVLTAFGVFWGIFMLILLLRAGRGMQNGVMQDFGSAVLDFIVINSGDTSVAYQGMGLGRKIRLEQEDIDAIANQVNGVRVVSGDTAQYGRTISYEGKNSSSPVHGVPDEFFLIKEDVPFNFGRKTNPLDDRDIRKITVIGTSVAERLFPPGTDPVGKDI